MLVIRDEQIQALIAPTEERLAKLVGEAVMSAVPVRLAPLATAQVEKMTARCIDRARSAGFEKAESIAAFAALMLVISPWFDRQPQIAEVLADEKFTKGELLCQLFERVQPLAWEHAAASNDANFWFDDGDVSEPVFTVGDEVIETTDHASLTLKQADIVDEAARKMEEDPSEAKGLELARELEKLCYHRAALKGTAAQRGFAAAEHARDFVLSRAIARPGPLN
ncbi:MAG TPA: hypothetical protein PKD26_12705 [Pyrinomonadaceae bacterium]|nr:hypothetical protein [Pyrinomonadaceae bacterium]